MRRSITLIFISAWLACSDAGNFADSGGIGGSGITQGSITALGSIVVNDIRWSIDTASLSDDGVPASPSDFQVGMVVTIEGTRSGTTGKATSVVADDAIEGPVAKINPVGANTKELTILGQTVIVDRLGTLFDNSSPGFGFDTIAVNDLVEVHGFAGTSIVATRVERKGSFIPGVSTPAIEVKGTVSSLAVGSFSIGMLSVLYDPAGVGTDLSDMPGGQVMGGDFVEVKGTLLTGGQVSANSFLGCTGDCRIELEGPIEGDADEFEIEGLVGGFTSLASFTVAGQPVDASGGAVEFEPAGLASSIANGVRVEVEGRLENGVVIATKVKQRTGSARIHAEIANNADVNPAAGTVLLLGVTLEVTAATKLEDDVGSVMGFGLDDLVAGDFLEVRGVANGTGSVTLSELKRKSTDDVRVRGPVDSFDATGRTVTILGVSISTIGTLDFNGFPGVATEGDFYAFLAANPGVTISAKDEVDGDETGFDFANEIEAED